MTFKGLPESGDAAAMAAESTALGGCGCIEGGPDVPAARRDEGRESDKPSRFGNGFNELSMGRVLGWDTG